MSKWLIGMMTALIAVSTWTTASAAERDYFLASTNYSLSRQQFSSSKRAALEGDQEAAERVAKYFEYAHHDRKAAFKWWKVGAENGSAECQFQLFQSLHSSDDVEIQRRALFWLRRAAAQNHDGAIATLSFCNSIEAVETFANGPSPCFGRGSE